MYKESFRKDLVDWAFNEMKKDSCVFSRMALQEAKLKNLWIITDLRRKADLNYILDKHKNGHLIVRLESKDESRRQRGWSYVKEIDEEWSECELDRGVTFDLIIPNNENGEEYIQDYVKKVKNIIDSSINKYVLSSD